MLYSEVWRPTPSSAHARGAARTSPRRNSPRRLGTSQPGRGRRARARRGRIRRSGTLDRRVASHRPPARALGAHMVAGRRRDRRYASSSPSRRPSACAALERHSAQPEAPDAIAGARAAVASCPEFRSRGACCARLVDVPTSTSSSSAASPSRPARTTPRSTRDLDICLRDRSRQSRRARAPSWSRLRARLRGVAEDVPFVPDERSARSASRSSPSSPTTATLDRARATLRARRRYDDAAQAAPIASTSAASRSRDRVLEDLIAMKRAAGPAAGSRPTSRRSRRSCASAPSG